MDKYKYATGWTEHDGYVVVSTFRACCACRLLDFDEDVSHFSRNRKTLTYVMNNKKRQLTPDFSVCYKQSHHYLHCYKDGSFTNEQIKLLTKEHSIHFWPESFLIDNPIIDNINLMRRYMHNGFRSPEFVQTLVVPTSIGRTFTAKAFREHLNYSPAEANMKLLQLAGYRKLTFDIRQPYSENTVFQVVEN
ncbi:hypothetical protein ACYVOU_002291 [Vibrio cholerae]